MDLCGELYGDTDEKYKWNTGSSVEIMESYFPLLCALATCFCFLAHLTVLLGLAALVSPFRQPFSSKERADKPAVRYVPCTKQLAGEDSGWLLAVFFSRWWRSESSFNKLWPEIQTLSWPSLR